MKLRLQDHNFSRATYCVFRRMMYIWYAYMHTLPRHAHACKHAYSVIRTQVRTYTYSHMLVTYLDGSCSNDGWHK